ncbi:MAG: hypothetical protein GTN71_01585 [Anaerolineae bacterium]|nr:hypothetical protein [Anaerolineae bacterium]
MHDDEITSKIPAPEVLEPCWRCNHEPIPAMTEWTDRDPGTLEPTGEKHVAHIHICSHCGYSVPGPSPGNQRGYPSQALAALRWNGDMISNRMRTAKEEREYKATLQLGQQPVPKGVQLAPRPK